MNTLWSVSCRPQHSGFQDRLPIPVNQSENTATASEQTWENSIFFTYNMKKCDKFLARIAFKASHFFCPLFDGNIEERKKTTNRRKIFYAVNNIVGRIAKNKVWIKLPFMYFLIIYILFSPFLYKPFIFKLSFYFLSRLFFYL